MRRALLVGISGRIGKELMEALLNDIRYKRITVLTRHEGRRLKNIHLQVVKTDFSNLDEHISDFEGIDDVYCLLDSDFINTNNVSDAELFDFEYPLNIAQVAEKAGVKNFVLLNHSEASLKNNLQKWNKRVKLEGIIREMNFENIYTFKVNGISKPVNAKGALYNLSNKMGMLLNTLSLGYVNKIKLTPANVLAKNMIATVSNNTKDKKEFSPKDY
jgi:nucleoside-diphosphate-sugar epimerase